MAGRVVGNISLKADIDGPNPAEARAHGELAGKEMGDGLDKAFGDRYTKMFRKFAKDVNNLFSDITDGDAGQFGMFDGQVKNLDANTTKVERDTKRVGSAFDKLSGAINRNRLQVENHGQSLKHWQAITLAVTTLILGAGNDMAALGSALGAGIVVLGAAAASVGIGAGVAIAAVAGLTGKIDDLPPSVRGAATAFQGLKGVLKDLRTDLTVAAFADSEGMWKSLGDTIKGLDPALQTVAKSVGQVFDRFAKAVAPGTKVFGELDQLIRQSGPIFSRFADIIGTFGAALLTAFSNPRTVKSINKLLDWIGKIADAFDRFVNSNEFDKWLDNADRVFGAIGGLIDSLGRTLDSLSTDKAVDSLDRLIGGVSDFLPVAGQLIDIGGKLDPLGLIADVLDGLGEAIQPLIKPLGDLATNLHHVAQIMIDEFSKNLKGVGDALAPLVQGVSDFLGSLDEKTIRGIADALTALAAAFVVVKGAKGIEGLSTKIKDLTGNITELSGKQAAMKGIGGALVGALTTSIAAAGTDGQSENPLLTLIGEWASAAVAGFVVGGPIGAALGLIGSIAASYIFQPQTITQAHAQTEAFMAQAIYLPLGEALLAIQQWGIDLQTSVMLGVTNFFTTLQTGWSVGWSTALLTVSTFVLQVAGTLQGGYQRFLTDLGSFVIDTETNWNNFWNGLYLTIGTYALMLGGAAGQLGKMVSDGVTNALAGLGTWWNSLWSGFGSTLSNAWGGMLATTRSNINGMISAVNGLLGPLNSVIKLFNQLTGLKVPTVNIPSLPKTAVGGVFAQAQARIIGEAGSEAVVPLNRPLSQVDPSVRGLSAIAQGKGVPAGSSRSGGGNVIFEAGSIVSPYADPALVAAQAADMVAEKIAV